MVVPNRWRNLKNANDYLAWNTRSFFGTYQNVTSIIHSFYKEQLLLSRWVISKSYADIEKTKTVDHTASFTSAALCTVGFILEENLMHGCCL